MISNSYLGGFAYQYSLVIDGKPYKTFLDQQSKIMKTWILPVDVGWLEVSKFSLSWIVGQGRSYRIYHRSPKSIGKCANPPNLKTISNLGGFAYQYSLVIDGKPYKTFLDQQSKIMKTWILPVDGEMCRVVLEKDTLDIWVNGKKVEVAAEFTDDGIHTQCL